MNHENALRAASRPLVFGQQARPMTLTEMETITKEQVREYLMACANLYPGMVMGDDRRRSEAAELLLAGFGGADV